MHDQFAPSDGDATEAAGLGKATVLLVVGDRDVRERMLGILNQRFCVLSTDDGQAALEMTRRARPDLILSDKDVADSGGSALLRALRDDPESSAIPVMILAGSEEALAGSEEALAGSEEALAGSEEEGRIESWGADDYLVAPFTERELRARIEAQLKIAQLRRQLLEQQVTLTNEIQRTREFAWETLEHLPDAFCTFDRAFRVTYLNPAAAQLSAQSNGPKVGEVLWDAYPALMGTPVEANLKRCMEERVAMEFEQHFPADGAEAWFHFQVYPQPSDGMGLCVRNTTAGRLTEQALRRAEQLAAAGRLAASIAHEINNPLEAVTNLLFLAKLDESISGNTRNLLEVADRELQRLSHITARSLKFYRQRTAASLTSIEELMDSVLFFHETEMRMRGIELERRYRAAPQAVCLAGEMQQVLTNLISNAIQAAGEHGRVVVGVRPGRDKNGAEQVLITVADSGAGMSPQLLDRLFHPFVTTKGESGTGLGLWVSKGILDKHNASTRVRSRPGLGTVFLIFLPVAPVLDPALAGPSPA